MIFIERLMRGWKHYTVTLRKVRPGLGNRVIHKDFYERGRYVAHNRDVRYSPTHSELLSDVD